MVTMEQPERLDGELGVPSGPHMVFDQFYFDVK